MAVVRLFAALVFLAGTLLAQRQMSVPQLVTFVKSSIQMRNDDRSVADFIGKIRLTNKLDSRTVEELQGAGIGPKTLAALRKLITATATLADPPPPEPPTAAATIPPPSSIEQKQILAEITQKALDYNKTLPNFICTQVTRRHVDPTGQENWRLLDTVQERLSYFDHKEEYTVILVDNKAVTNVSHNQLGGSTSSGEFGSMLAEIFSPESHTEFEWLRWGTWRGRRVHVYEFRVPQRYSQYTILSVDTGRQIVAGYHGLIFADRDSKRVMRIKLDADTIPRDFPIQNVSLDLQYDFANIAGQDFVLPLKADLRSSQGRLLTWNDVEFHLYRRFEADTSITFDPVGEIPDAQEEPAQPDPPKK
jgi:hypothetical protein